MEPAVASASSSRHFFQHSITTTSTSIRYMHDNNAHDDDDITTSKFTHRMNEASPPSTSDLRTQILNTTLAEVQRQGDDSICVICLEQVSEKAQAQPCRHEFDFLCLISWLDERNACPLCKSHVTSVRYAFQGDKFSTYTVTATSSQTATQSGSSRTQARRVNYRRPERRQPATLDAAIARRKEVYANGLYSLHVGANRLSRYENLTPSAIVGSPAQLSRARKWIRRELRAFDFLCSDSRESRGAVRSNDPASRSGINNAEFLLEYIVAIVRTVDLRGSQGQAHEMVAEFLGGETARLFIHELSAWLRSPYEDLESWDAHVQYPPVPPSSHVGDKRGEAEGELQWTRKRRRVDRYVPEYRTR